MNAPIAVYADWQGLGAPRRLGHLHARRSAGGELLAFEYDGEALLDPQLGALSLDPRLGLFAGPQYPLAGQAFGVFADASPDRWGRMLMQRRLERDKRAGKVPANTRLYESDYLLGVHDQYRVGALRFRAGDRGPFLDDRHDRAAPPMVRLRELEAASLALERDVENDAPDADAWLRLLIAPGGSLGGARPKASVVDAEGHLWIAKFPSLYDDFDVGAWELLVNTLALNCDLRVAEGRAARYASPRHCFMVKRFDRTAGGGRLHFASAMTLTGHIDGDDAQSGASYLELARVLIEQGAEPNADLRELWSRILFNMLVSNCDDHLRNHGFLLQPGRGWRLSPAYDMNPVPFAQGLKLNVSEADNQLDLDLARSVAGYFRVSLAEADERIDAFRQVVGQWRILADHLGVSTREQQAMAPAFRLAGR
ncbi:type II toxin-antitoxin system HipA family toxin [Pseudomonas knackmussii]|uniref:type II toxin-antitoxin system HipA family toxin n=1 Tax=Pseudomonas knackmussii TaxID=65741 RepID=UPI003BEC1172